MILITRQQIKFFSIATNNMDLSLSYDILSKKIDWNNNSYCYPSSSSSSVIVAAV